ncbi:hypothetical protein KV557_37705 [Kitasatospora aureofaciens]|uniref:hypothetical protein n=1 Tax=Kitasatospora aureofaciens TaxID=1894 RepID=UPI001C48475C|nr:hypothetical protein [Kitasatospora aureofaciens]MBV6702772.1 hypothetical protein [Kitasatospora aureofaciens]
MVRPDCDSTSSAASLSVRSRRNRARIFSMPASGAVSWRSCSAVAMRNWNSAAQVISTSRVSLSGSALARVLVFDATDVLLDFGGEQFSERSPN